MKIVLPKENYSTEILSATLYVDEEGVFGADNYMEKPNITYDGSIISCIRRDLRLMEYNVHCVILSFDFNSVFSLMTGRMAPPGLFTYFESSSMLPSDVTMGAVTEVLSPRSHHQEER